jgi:hypothetical protein
VMGVAKSLKCRKGMVQAVAFVVNISRLVVTASVVLDPLAAVAAAFEDDPPNPLPVHRKRLLPG